jgi:hypothetical protein
LGHAGNELPRLHGLRRWRGRLARRVQEYRRSRVREAKRGYPRTTGTALALGRGGSIPARWPTVGHKLAAWPRRQQPSKGGFYAKSVTNSRFRRRGRGIGGVRRGCASRRKSDWSHSRRWGGCGRNCGHLWCLSSSAHNRRSHCRGRERGAVNGGRKPERLDWGCMRQAASRYLS